MSDSENRKTQNPTPPTSENQPPTSQTIEEKVSNPTNQAATLEDENFETNRANMKITDEDLKGIDPRHIIANKLKDHASRVNAIKYDNLCQNFAYYQICSSTITSAHCCFQHNYIVRYAKLQENKQIKKKTLKDKEEATKILKSEGNYLTNLSLMKKYPDPLNPAQNDFIERFAENQKWITQIKEY